MLNNYINPLYHTINSTLYNVVWFLAIFTQVYKSYGFWFYDSAVFALLVQFFFCIKIDKNYKKLLFVGGLSFSGVLIDSILLFLNIIEYNEKLLFISPFFIILIWISFSLFFVYTMNHFLKSNLLLGALSFLGFGLAYYSASKIDIVALHEGMISLAVISTVWGIGLPLVNIFYQKYKVLE